MSDHDPIVEGIIDFLIKSEHQNLRADLPGYDQPEEINAPDGRESFIPDITSQKSGKFHIFEIETSEGLKTDHSIQQIGAFAEHASEISAKFTLVVPEDVEDEARALMNDLGFIDAGILGV